MTRIRVWDLPTRLFHWLLVLAVLAAFVSVKLEKLDWHASAGLFILGLLVFRLVWGVIGSRHSRFAHFVGGPRAIRAYLQGRWHGHGHNPLGALAVIAFLFLLGVQALSGLFANDDSLFEGPLVALVSRETSDLLSRIHRWQEWPIIGLVLLHVTAIAFYARVKKTNLLTPMLTGNKVVTSQAPDAVDEKSADASAQDAVDDDPDEPRGLTARGSALACLVAVLLALAAVYAASGALLPAPPPAELLPAAPAW